MVRPEFRQAIIEDIASHTMANKDERLVRVLLSLPCGIKIGEDDLKNRLLGTFLFPALQVDEGIA